MATNQVPADTIFDRYGLASQQPFSQAFTDSVSSLYGALTPISTGEDNSSQPTPAENPLAELQAYKNLNLLWSLMVQELTETIPSAEHVGAVMAAEFRWQGDSQVIGKRSFVYDEQVLDTYVREELSWWRGEREAKGVEIEDAFKCHTCEFAEGCEWRIKKVEDAVVRSRTRKGRQKTVA